MDGFHARPLRRILGIPAALVSRVSGKIAFSQAGVNPLSSQLYQKQLLLIGRVARVPGGDDIRKDVFVGDSMQPCVGNFVRRVVRPRQEWTTEVFKAAVEHCGGLARATTLLRGTEKEWKTEVAKSRR